MNSRYGLRAFSTFTHFTVYQSCSNRLKVTVQMKAWLSCGRETEEWMSGMGILRNPWGTGLGVLATMFRVRGSSLCLTLKRHLVSGQPGLVPTVSSYVSHF